MDKIPPDKFIELFKRLSETVRLGRVRNPRDIRKRMKRVLDWYRHAYTVAKRASTIVKYRVKYKRLRILYRGRIERRIWQEKEANPEGMVGLTLDYGFDNAQEILKEGVRRRAGRMRLVR